MSKVIVLDPGHYKGYNTYPPFKSYNEGEQMWKLANKLKDKLTANGFKVILTKSSASADVGLTSRGATAGNNKADMFISMHSNAVANKVDDSVTGVETYYSIFDSKGKDFATKINSAIVKVMNTKDRGAKTRKGSGNWDYYSVIKGAVDSGCKQAFLIEHGFHTSTKDASFLIKDENLDKIAEAECKVICEYFGVKQKTATSSASTQAKPSVKYYPKYTGKSGSIVDALNSLKIDSSFTHRKKIAKANSISAYLGTAKQNTQMLELLKKGKLIKE